MSTIDGENNRCFVCGPSVADGLRIHFEGDKAGVYAVTSVPEPWQGLTGIVHGGILAGLLDDAMWHAIYQYGDLATMTAELTVRYQHPVRIGQRIEIAARVTRFSRRLAVAEAEIRDLERVLIRGKGTFMPGPMSGGLRS